MITHKMVSRGACEYCQKALELIEDHGDDVEVLTLTTQDQVNLYKFLGHKTVPHIIGIGGYNDLVRYYEEKEKGR